MTHVMPGYTAVTPWIISSDTDALFRFITQAFGGVEIGRVPLADGSLGHAEIRIGDAVVMAFDAPKGTEPVPAFLRLFVEDARHAFAKALEAGATDVTKPTLLAFGSRVGRVRDPLGNIWWLEQHVEDVSPDVLQQRWTEPKWIEPMTYVQETLARALRGGDGAAGRPAP